MFLNVILFLKADSHVLLTRSPLKITFPYDLHVLSIPLAFILSQDQTLRLFFYNMLPPCPLLFAVFPKEKRGIRGGRRKPFRGRGRC